jgi:4-hydroxybenzoate polyprenyltransferase
LYSFPLYRGKAYFPANIKMEGVWAATAFFAGVVTSWEHQLAGGNMFSVKTAFWGMTQNPAVGFTPGLLWAVFLVFGGWSLLSTVKDYKDITGDAAAGVQTVYTLAARRGINVARLHARLALVGSIFLVLPPVLLYAAERLPAAALVVCVSAPLWHRLILQSDNARRFRRFLLALSVYLASLAWAMLKASP